MIQELSEMAALFFGADDCKNIFYTYIPLHNLHETKIQAYE